MVFSLTPSLRWFAIAMIFVVIASGIGGGCDRTSETSAPATSSPGDPTPVTRHVQIETLAQTRANRITHVCVDPATSDLYWTQESDDGQDVMFVLPRAAAPASGAAAGGAGSGTELTRATELTTAAILAATDPGGGSSSSSSSASSPSASSSSASAHASAVKQKNRTGAIQSIAAGPDGEIYFFFSGGAGRATRVILGRFDPKAGARDAIRILADTAILADATGMGGSISLARGQLIVQRVANAAIAARAPAAASHILLFIRHTDAWAIFRFEPRLLPESAMLQLSRSKVPGLSTELHRADTGEALNLSREELELSAGPDESLLACDRSNGIAYRIEPAGACAPFASMLGLPETFTAPAPMSDDLIGVDALAADRAARASRPSVIADAPAEGYAIFFAPEGAPIDPKRGERPDPPDVHPNYPALLSVAIRVPAEKSETLPTGRWASLDRDDIRAPSDLSVRGMRLSQLVAIDPGTFAANRSAAVRTIAAFVGYDGASGQLLRVRIVEKR